MPTVTVSSSAELSTALKTAAQDTTIQLRSGSYILSAHGAQDFHGAVITAAAGAKVSFSSVNINGISHVTFDNVDFDQKAGALKSFVIASTTDVTVRNVDITGTINADGFGAGTGLWVSKNTGFTLENSSVKDFKTGVWIQATTDLHVGNNEITNISLDGMIVGGVHDAYFNNNHVSLRVPAGTKHTDGMQFYNSEVNDPSSHFVIRDNFIETHNAASHGIYLANGIADDTGDPGSFYQNLIIKHNTVVSGQVSGIAVGQVNGLSVYANTILQDASFYSTRDIGTPVIRVHAASTNVGVTGNITHKLPEASGPDWFPTHVREPEWTIANNKYVPIGTTLANLPNTPLVPFPNATAAAGADAFVFGASARAAEAPVSDAAVATADEAVHHLGIDHGFF